MGKEVKFLTAEEMVQRHKNQEDPFSLVLDKWTRIQSCLNIAFTREDYLDILEASQIPIPFCMELGARDACHLCPLKHICQPPDEGLESFWSGMYRLLQAYAWAGDFIDPEPLKRIVSELISRVREARESLNTGPR